MRERPCASSFGGTAFASLRQTRTTARCEGQPAFGTRTTSFKTQPLAAEGLAAAASTSRARGWQRALLRTAEGIAAQAVALLVAGNEEP